MQPLLDIFYLTYHDDYSEENFEQLKKLAGFPQRVIHVADIDGIYNAHKECAKQSKTKHFFVVDGDAWVKEDFNFSYIPSETDEVYPETSSAQCTHVWRAENPYTGLVYGYGGVKLFARDAFMDKAYIDVKFPVVDVTTEVAKRGYPYLPMETVSNETRFATTPFNAWKSAFRETVKLASGVATQERKERLEAWKNPTENSPYRSEIILGAKMGDNYGSANAGNGDLLFRINNYGKWLKTWFQERKEWKPLRVSEQILDFPDREAFIDGRFMINGIHQFSEWINHPELEQIEEMRQAVMLGREESIEKLQDWLIWGPKNPKSLKFFLQYLYSGKNKKFNPERCIHYMLEVHDDNSPQKFFGELMGAIINTKELNVNYIDALSSGQINSKIWLIDELKNLDTSFENTLVIGGWLGLSSNWIMKNKISKNITNLDLDADAIKFSDELNKYVTGYNEGIVEDITQFSHNEYDLVINTSAEHMNEEWFENIKLGTTVVIQTNDFHDLPEHINTVNDIDDMKSKFPMSNILFEGVKDVVRYNRYMLIGKK